MNLGAIRADLYGILNYAASPAAEVAARLDRYVNQTHRLILTKPGMERLRDDTLTIAAVASQGRYGLPPAVAKIQHLADRANDRRLLERPLAWLRTVDPGLSSVGGPSSYYIPLGSQQVQLQPTVPAGLWAVSSTTDVTAKVFAETILTGGYPHVVVTAGTALTSATRVQLGVRTDHMEVTKFYLDVAAAGSVSLYDAATGGTELARIAPGTLYARYLAIELWPTPTDAITYHLDYTRTIPDLSAATDEPLLPEDFHRLLVDGALVKEWTKKDDAGRREAAKRDLTEGIAALTSWVLSNAETTASLRPTAQGWSSLGGQYPADVWR